MTYRIPDDDKLAEAIFVVMYRNQQVKSQNEMTTLVRRELNKENEDEFRVSGERIRRIAVNRGLLQLVIEYNESVISGLPDTCPVCRNPMEAVTNRTLDGGMIEVSRKCSVCPYSVGTRRRMPGRYTFMRKKA
jgi:hypothetical protein